MARANQGRLAQSAFLALGFVFLLTVVVFAEDPPFAGKWKGETRPAAATAAGTTAGTAPATGAGAAPAAGAPAGGGGAAAAPAGAGGAGGRGGAGGGGGRGGAGGGGGRGGGAGFGGGAGGFGGPQKVSLNLKQSKDNKVSGNITFGETDTNDVKDGKVDGNTLTFKAGRAPQPIYEYKAELKDNQMVLTRNSPDGRGRATEYVLTKK